MKVVILAGGLGTRISEESHLRPKPMIEIGGKPILWHIMKIYSYYGFNEFVICLGYKQHIVKEFFSNYFLHMSDVTFDLEKNRAYTAEEGIVVIRPFEQEDSAESKPANALVTTADLEVVWDGASLSAENYTLPAEVQLEDGSVGVLSIPKIGLSAPVYESEDGDEMESMTKGIAHFATTSAWDGNVGLCSHNVPPAGAVAFFRDLHLLEAGDTLTYQTAQGERQYQVIEVREIAGDDWSYLSRTDDNRVTMITCITGKPDLRLMVQAKEI